MSGDVDINKTPIGGIINATTGGLADAAGGVEAEASDMGEGLGTALSIIFYLLPIFILLAFVLIVLAMPSKVIAIANKIKGNVK